MFDPRPVHEFTELLKRAKELNPTDAIEAYEAGLALYMGDLKTV